MKGEKVYGLGRNFTAVFSFEQLIKRLWHGEIKYVIKELKIIK
jgi:hypothetical protein